MRPLIFLCVSLACGSPALEQEVPRFDSRTVHLGVEEPAALVVADINGDGAPDLLVAAALLHVLIGDGAGNFSARAPIDAGPNPNGIATADFNGDGRLDVAVANHETDQVTILLGTGSGGLQAAPDSPLRLILSPHPHTLAAGDFDRDGRHDLLVDDRDAGAMLLLPGLGDGRFGPQRSIPVGGDPYREPWVGDLDGDGALDLATPNERSVAVLRGNGAGSFVPLPGTPIPVPAPFAVVVADVNGDGHADLATMPDERISGLTVLLGQPSGGFLPAPGSPFTGVDGPGRLVAGDLDGDGIADLVAGGWPRRTVLVVLGGRDRLSAFEVVAGTNPWSVAVGDLDRDGRLDIATANAGSRDVTLLFNRGR